METDSKAVSRVNPLWILVALMVISLMARILFVSLFLERDKYYWNDTIHYYSAAASIVEEGTFGVNPERLDREIPYGLEPVYPLFMTPFVYAFGGDFWVTRVAQNLLIVLAVLLLYSVITWLAGEWFALLGAVYYLFYPFYFYLGSMLYPESIFLPALLLYVYWTLRYVREHRDRFLYLSVACLAIMGHLKMTAWSLALVTLVAFLMVNRKINGKFLLKGFAAALLFLLLSLPWGVRNYMVKGEITLPRDRKPAEESAEISQQLESRHSLLQNIYETFSPDLTRVKTRNKFNSPWARALSIVSVTPLLAATLALIFLRRDRLVLLLYGVFLAYNLPYLLIKGQTRYRLPIDFVMMIFFALVLHWLWKQWESRSEAGSESAVPSK